MANPTLTRYREPAIIYHMPGDHDQESHGNWADGGSELSEIGDISREEFDKTGQQVGSNLKERWTRVVGADDESRLPNLKNHMPDYRQTRWIKNPPSEVTIYRAVPGAAGSIRPGDWIALDRSYAAGHTGGRTKAKIVSLKVSANDVVWAGTDENEFFYAPKRFAVPRAQTTFDGIEELRRKFRAPK